MKSQAQKDYSDLCGTIHTPAIAEALENARVLEILDNWRLSLSGGTWTMGFRNSCLLRIHDLATGQVDREYVFDGRTPSAARAAAAAAILAGSV